MDSYQVTGVVQAQIHGAWSERAMTIAVKAFTAAQAREAALSTLRRVNEVTDPHSVTRWHTPELVRAQQVRNAQC